LTCAEVVERRLVDVELWDRVMAAALDVFEHGQQLAGKAGLILADTKYEFGLGPTGQLLCIDELHTPDSSRFWALDTMDDRLAAGLAPESFDKEPVRLALRAAGYTGNGPQPELAASVLADTSTRYVELYERLTGTGFEPGARPVAKRLAANLAPLLGEPPHERQ
jgi:phosphoribosylaminoimidazole-succinocarboxamide synthase